MKFAMSITDNYASFIDKNSGAAVFVESFDNQKFEVRIGTINSSELARSIFAQTTEELNAKLFSMYEMRNYIPCVISKIKGATGKEYREEMTLGITITMRRDFPAMN